MSNHRNWLNSTDYIERDMSQAGFRGTISFSAPKRSFGELVVSSGLYAVHTVS